MNRAIAEPTASTYFLPAENSFNQSRNRLIYSKIHLTAVLVSFVCLILGIVTITPSLDVAWQLRFSGQIIVVGFLLSIMNVCLQNVLTFAFLLIEARFGQSRLQSLDAIASGKPMVSGVSKRWRITLLGMFMLPLGLSVAYKRFLGGTVGVDFTPTSSGLYGIELSTGGLEDHLKGDFLFMGMRSIDAIRTAMLLGDQQFPRAEDFPVAYGYHTLLLSNDTVAVLDMPTSSYVEDLQSRIDIGDSVDIKASVGAYKAVYNQSTTALRTEDGLWSEILPIEGLLKTVYMYDAMSSRFGFITWEDNSQILIALYPQSTIPNDYRTFDYSENPANEELKQFRKRANLYNIRRANCHGHWRINTTSIALLDGHCDNGPANSSILTRDPFMGPWEAEFLPLLSRMVPDTSTAGLDWVWLPAMYAATISIAYFTRSHSIISTRGWDLNYVSSNEKIIINRPVLSTEWPLYVVLAVQPVLTVLGYMVIIWLHGTLISKDFGITSVVSRLSPDSLDYFQGPGLLAKLKQPWRLASEAKPVIPTDRSESVSSQIQYTLKPESKS